MQQLIMKKFIPILFISLLFYSCNSIDPVELNEFQINLNKWESKNINSYIITLKMSCFCIPTDPIDIKVENNQITEINSAPVTSEQLNNEYWYAKTIDELFIFIDENIKEEPFQQVLEFNETYGFPEYIYFNREEMLVDEEIGYTISSFNID
tara:strand:+ start:575 stop:1030 length:456 start_codon:yes stop_codon:yes gene_type:complete